MLKRWAELCSYAYNICRVYEGRIATFTWHSNARLEAVNPKKCYNYENWWWINWGLNIVRLKEAWYVSTRTNQLVSYSKRLQWQMTTTRITKFKNGIHNSENHQQPNFTINSKRCVDAAEDEELLIKTEIEMNFNSKYAWTILNE